MGRKLEWDWYPGTVPDNVIIDDGAYLESSFSFHLFRSERDPTPDGDNRIEDRALAARERRRNGRPFSHVRTVHRLWIGRGAARRNSPRSCDPSPLS